MQTKLYAVKYYVSCDKLCHQNHGSKTVYAALTFIRIWVCRDLHKFNSIHVCENYHQLYTCHVNPWITEQWKFQLFLYWVHFVPNFLIIFSTCFFPNLYHRLKDKKVFLVSFFITYALTKNEMPKMFKNKKTVYNRTVPEICLYYDLSLQFLHVIWLFLREWCLHAY